MVDSRREREAGNGGERSLAAVVDTVHDHEITLGRIEERLRRIEAEIGGMRVQLGDVAMLLHNVVNARRTPPSMQAVRSLPPTAEITQAGTRAVLPLEDAIELQKLAARVRWWRGTAKDVALGIVSTAVKWAIPAALAYVATHYLHL
jgi:hypothetical protein